MKSITIEIKIIYGNKLIYPVCESAVKFASLVNAKTFNLNQLRIIRDLGYEIIQDFGSGFTQPFEF